MMIGLSSITVDTDGNVTFDIFPSSEYKNSSRRVSRIKTLDGGAVLVDGGFSDSDRTFNINAGYTLDRYTTIDYLHKNSTLIYISLDENFYSGVIADLRLNRGTQEIIKIQILVKEKLN